MTELKPCPFCGGDAHFKEVVSCSETLYAAGCSDYGCIGFETLYYVPTKDNAAEAWNRRANECDRDALRKVADEINIDAEHISGYLDSCEGNFAKYEVNEYYKLTGWVDRIREALGVEK